MARRRFIYGPTAAFVRRLVTVGGAVLFLALVLAASAAAAPVWHATTPETRFPGFLGVGAASTTDVWAVGENDADRETPYAEHWNGTSWTTVGVALPAGTLPNGGVYDVSALSSTNAWTVGWTDRDTNNRHFYPLIDHWNGRAWKVMTAPAPTDSWLASVSAISPTNVWAAGVGPSSAPALVEHYNGTAWKIVPAPGTAGLSSIRAVSASNVWASGGNQLEHYNGTAWKLVSYPGSASGALSFGDISRVPGTTHLWVVGANTAASPSTPVALFYNGTTWSSTSVPGLGSLSTVAATSSTNAWAAGVDGQRNPITMHWNGTRWTQVTGTVLDGGQIAAMTHTPSSSQLWAVGSDTANEDTFAAYLQ